MALAHRQTPIVGFDSDWFDGADSPDRIEDLANLVKGHL